MKAALEAIRGEATIARLAIRHGGRQTVIPTLKRQAIEGMAEPQAAEKEGEIETPYAKIGQLLVERNFLVRASGR